ncbi:MAG: hypothetical protein J6B89_03470 [Bacilli bacterium]|nr:hypothetical protein [Bacilli bacterium]
MLSEETLERLSERLVNRIEELNTFMINKLGEQIIDIGTLTPSQLNEVFQSIKYGNSLDEIINKLAEITDKNVNDIYEIFEEIAKQAQGYAKQFYEYRNINFVPFDKNIALQNQVKAIAKSTVNEYLNISKTMAYAMHNKGIKEFSSLSETYQKVTDRAILSISQGRESFDTVMKRTMKELTSQGLRTVDYASGYSRRLDSSVRMNLLDGLRRLNRELQEEFGKEFGSDGIEVSHHKYAAPDHIDTIDGQQFSRHGKVTIDGVTYEDYDTVNNKLDRHVGDLNCQHFTFSIVLGITKPLYSKEELEADRKANESGFEFEGKHYTMYEGTQLQRRIETKIREYKDRYVGAKSINDYDEVYHCQTKIRQLTQKYKELSDISGLPTQVDRLRVEGYKQVKQAKIGNLSNNIKQNGDSKINKQYLENVKAKDYTEVINKYEENIFNKKIENAIMIEECGDVYKFLGTDNYVNIEGNLKKAIITHNHPTFKEEIGGSFSEDDFKLLVKHQDIKQLRAVDEKYVYTTKVLNKIQTTDYKEALFNVIPVDNEDFKHLIFEELKKKGLVEYERKLRNRNK